MKSYSKAIELLLNLRFSEENKIIKDNASNPINIIIIKIVWLESNINYIEKILKAFEISKDIINDNDGIQLNQMIYDSIYDKERPIQYIVNEERNPEFKRELNECFYILLTGLCLNVTFKDIQLVEITIKDYRNK